MALSLPELTEMCVFREQRTCTPQPGDYVESSCDQHPETEMPLQLCCQCASNQRGAQKATTLKQ